MNKVPRIHRLFLGIITGTFMFAAYFLLDMLLAGSYPEVYHSWFGENQMYYYMFAFLVGIIGVQIFFWYYNRGVRRIKRVQTNAN